MGQFGFNGFVLTGNFLGDDLCKLLFSRRLNVKNGLKIMGSFGKNGEVKKGLGVWLEA
jgi:hypothetical protein